MFLITKTEITNTGHFEAGTSIYYKKNMYIIITYESEIEFFIAANTWLITSSLLIIFWRTSKKSEDTTSD